MQTCLILPGTRPRREGHAPRGRCCRNSESAPCLIARLGRSILASRSRAWARLRHHFKPRTGPTPRLCPAQGMPAGANDHVPSTTRRVCRARLIRLAKCAGSSNSALALAHWSTPYERLTETKRMPYPRLATGIAALALLGASAAALAQDGGWEKNSELGARRMSAATTSNPNGCCENAGPARAARQERREFGACS